MKNSLFLVLFLAMAILAGCGHEKNKLDVKDVPDAVKAAFTKLYADVKEASWEKENGIYEAEFDLNSKEMSVEMDSLGTLLKTETEVEEKDVPENVKASFKALHPEVECVEWDLVDGKYEAEYKTETSVTFDESGKLIEKPKCCMEKMVSCQEMELKESDVPAVIVEKFKKLYPKAEETGWTKENNSFEAEFEINDKEVSCVFDTAGNLLETENAIEISALPKVINDYITKNVPGATIKEATKIVDAKGLVTYEAEVNDADYMFDAKGTFIKKSEEKQDTEDKD
jgi:hypothetical protein